MLTPAQGKRQRAALMREVAREERRKQRQALVDLRAEIRQARAARKEALHEAKSACRQGRLQLRAHIAQERARILAEMRERFASEKQQAKDACSAGLSAARALSEAHARARGKLAAERAFRRDMKRIERDNRDRARALSRPLSRTQKSESDDEVRTNIPFELHALFAQVGRKIRGTDRMTRTEAFLHYAEEHPEEVLLSIEHESERKLEELERRERQAHQALRRAVPRRAYEQASGEEAPF